MMTTARRKPRIVDGSCWPCRKRRIKCDLGKPCCTRCLDNGQICDYNLSKNPIRWVGGMAMRGHLAHSSSKSSASPEPVQETDAVQTTTTTSSSSSPSSLVVPPVPSNILKQENLLLYFTRVVLPRFILPEKMFEIDETFFFENEALQRATLALSQAHYVIHGKAESASSHEQRLKQQRSRHHAIQSFRMNLATGAETGEESSHALGGSKDQVVQRLFVVNVMLCILDGMIEPLDGDIHASAQHLRGGRAILSQWGHIAGNMLEQDGLPQHLISVFATIDLVHAMLSGESPFFEPPFWRLFGGVKAWWGCLGHDDEFLATLEVFSEMSHLASLTFAAAAAASSPASDRSSNPLEATLPRLEKFLSSTSRTASESSELVLRDDADYLAHWDKFCDLYKLCGRLYLLRAMRLAPIDDAEVQSYAREAAGRFATDPLPGMLNHCTIFPILVIGCHCLVPADRPVIHKALVSAAEFLSFGNLQVMDSFLKKTWQQFDQTQATDSAPMNMTWWEQFHEISSKAFFF